MTFLEIDNIFKKHQFSFHVAFRSKENIQESFHQALWEILSLEYERYLKLEGDYKNRGRTEDNYHKFVQAVEFLRLFLGTSYVTKYVIYCNFDLFESEPSLSLNIPKATSSWKYRVRLLIPSIEVIFERTIDLKDTSMETSNKVLKMTRLQVLQS